MNATTVAVDLAKSVFHLAVADDHIGVDSEPPHISPARGPPLWDDCDAHAGEGVAAEPDWDLAAQPVLDYEVDQRINW